MSYYQFAAFKLHAQKYSSTYQTALPKCFPQQSMVKPSSILPKLLPMSFVEVYQASRSHFHFKFMIIYTCKILLYSQLYLKPIRVSCLLPSDVITAIFNNIEGILSVNSELLRYMKQQSVGEAFSYLGPFLKLYSSYSSNYQTAIETLEVRTWSLNIRCSSTHSNCSVL